MCAAANPALLLDNLVLSLGLTGWPKGCILDWQKIRNTRINNSDPERLREAIRIFRDSVPDAEYPVGTILQLVPFEAMVKHPRERFPKTDGWEFFALDVSDAGTKIIDRGDNVVN